jgi:hypothetical protein
MQVVKSKNSIQNCVCSVLSPSKEMRQSAVAFSDIRSKENSFVSITFDGNVPVVRMEDMV